MAERLPHFVIMLRAAKDALEEAMQCAPDEGYRFETRRCLNRVEELVEDANRTQGVKP